MWLILSILALILVEIGLFVVIGGAIGLWLTLLWVILAAALGIILLKGIASLGPVTLSRNMQEFGNVLSPLAHRLLVLMAGLLLLIPGFFTDVIGLLLLFAPVRRVAIRKIGRRFRVDAVQTSAQVDLGQGDWRELTPDGRTVDAKDAPQTRH